RLSCQFAGVNRPHTSLARPARRRGLRSRPALGRHWRAARLRRGAQRARHGPGRRPRRLRRRQMETTHRLLGGEAVRIDVPGASGLPGGTSIGVLALEGAGAMEVTGGREADLAFFLEVTGTSLAREVALRDGRTLRYGRFHDDPAQGLGWAVALEGGHHLFGHTVPVLD